MIMPLIFLFVLAVSLAFYFLKPKKNKAPKLEPDIELALKEKVSAIFDGKTDWKLCGNGNDDDCLRLTFEHVEVFPEYMNIFVEPNGKLSVMYADTNEDELSFVDKAFYARALAVLKERDNERIKRKIDVL